MITQTKSKKKEKNPKEEKNPKKRKFLKWGSFPLIHFVEIMIFFVFLKLEKILYTMTYDIRWVVVVVVKSFVI